MLNLFMNDLSMLDTLAENIRALGYSAAQADAWAAIIGDTPVIDGSHLIVQSGSEILARLPLSAFPDLV